MGGPAHLLLASLSGHQGKCYRVAVRWRRCLFATIVLCVCSLFVGLSNGQGNVENRLPLEFAGVETVRHHLGQFTIKVGESFRVFLFLLSRHNNLLFEVQTIFVLTVWRSLVLLALMCACASYKPRSRPHHFLPQTIRRRPHPQLKDLRRQLLRLRTNHPPAVRFLWSCLALAPAARFLWSCLAPAFDSSVSLIPQKLTPPLRKSKRFSIADWSLRRCLE